jgi:hypothetical protein
VLGADASAIVATAGSTLGVVAQLELVVVGGVLLVLAVLLLTRELRRWRRAQPPDSEEIRARALMGELCPNGWHARITLYSADGATPPDAPRYEGGLVAVDWSELADTDPAQPVTRRIWAPTIAAGLAAMVDDRRTDEVLERIEGGFDDDPWDAV